MKKATLDYMDKAAVNSNIMDALCDALKGHSDRQATEPGNWGYSGDMGHFNSQLLNVLMGALPEDHPAKKVCDEDEAAGMAMLLKMIAK